MRKRPTMSAADPATDARRPTLEAPPVRHRLSCRCRPRRTGPSPPPPAWVLTNGCSVEVGQFQHGAAPHGQHVATPIPIMLEKPVAAATEMMVPTCHVCSSQGGHRSKPRHSSQKNRALIRAKIGSPVATIRTPPRRHRRKPLKLGAANQLLVPARASSSCSETVVMVTKEVCPRIRRLQQLLVAVPEKKFSCSSKMDRRSQRTSRRPSKKLVGRRSSRRR